MILDVIGVNGYAFRMSKYTPLIPLTAVVTSTPLLSTNAELAPSRIESLVTTIRLPFSSSTEPLPWRQLRFFGLLSVRQVWTSERHGVKRSSQIFRGGLFWFDDSWSSYLSKMPFVKRGYLAPALQGRCTNNQVIEANHFPGDLQFGPDTRMLVRSLLCVGDDRQGLQNGAQVTLPRHLCRPVP